MSRSRSGEPQRRTRRLAAAALCTAVVVFGLCAALASPPAQAFTDVPVLHPYLPAITDLSEREVISGFLDGSFRPEQAVWRQQFAKMIVATLRLPTTEEDRCPFTDVEQSGPGSLYPDHYVAVAARNNITNGTAPGIFSPSANISRAQLLTMVVRAGRDVSHVVFRAPDAAYFATGGGLMAGFSDPTHGDNVHVAEFNGLLEGISLDGWDLWGDATRGEVAQILYNAVRVLGIGMVRVEADGSGDYPTLNAALDAAPRGAVVVLGAGTFTLPDMSGQNRSLRLIGAGAGRTFVDCSIPNSLYFYRAGVLTVRDITFRYTSTQPGVILGVFDTVVDIAGCEFRNAVFDPASFAGGVGLGLTDCRGVVARSAFLDNGFAGLDIVGTSQLRVLGNTAEGNAYAGFFYSGFGGGWATNNTALHNGSGFHIQEQAAPKLFKNMCSENSWAGLEFIAYTTAEAIGNACSANRFGIYIGRDANPVLASNDVSGSTEADILDLRVTP